MKLSILIATLGRRGKKLRKLVEHLSTQADNYPGEIEILAYWNNGELPIGCIRQRLLRAAQGEYVCYIDDDDWVPEDYCQNIISSLGKDYVGFEVAFFNDGKRKPRVFHSLKYDKWFEAYDGYYRNVTHLNPMRRELALMGDFSLTETAGEDAKWASQVAPFVKTENYIDGVMYFYYHESMDTSFGTNEENPKSRKFPREKIDSPHFRYIEETS